MKYHEAYNCLDCDYTGTLVVVAGISQCPQCASRAVWPVSGWTKRPVDYMPPYHQRQPTVPDSRRCCDMVPTFFGGPGHAQ